MVSDEATTAAADDPHYPAHWEADVVMRDGRTMRVRPILPSDAEAIQTMHRGQSESSVLFRFFAPRGDLTEAELHRFTNVDHRARVALVMVSDEGLHGIGRFDATGQGAAEVAFYVSDQLHGLGLGSVLLEHLAAAAGEVGIETFTAEMLPSNGKMLRVFRDAGFPISVYTEDGTMFIELALEDTAKAWEVRAEREHRAESLSMAHILGAQGIVIGACGTLRAADELALARIRRRCEGFRGTVLDGNPAELLAQRRSGHRDAQAPDQAAGRPGAAQAGAVSLAVLAGPPADIIAAIEDVADLGVRGVVVVSGGFAELATLADPGARSEGLRRQRELLSATRSFGLRLFGPRSFGIMAAGEHGVLNVMAENSRESSEALALRRLRDAQDADRAQQVADTKGVGLFAQSAESSHMLVARSRARGVPLASAISGGNRADVSGNDAMQWWMLHEPTQVAVTYLESIGNPRKYSRIARRLARTMPVVGYVAETVGSAAPPGHRVRTSAWPARVLHELMRQAGVQRVSSVTELMDLTSVLATQPALPGNTVAVIGSSPAYAGHMAELLRADSFDTAIVAAAELADGPQALDHVLAGVSSDESIDAVIVGLSEALGDVTAGHAEVVARHAARHAERRDVPWIVVDGTRTGCHPDYHVEGNTVPAVGTARAVGRVLGHQRERAQWLARASEELVSSHGIEPKKARAHLHPLVRAEVTELSAEDTRAILSYFGISVLPTFRVTSPQDAVRAAVEARGAAGDSEPVVLKLDDPLLSSRSSLGGLRLGIRGDQAVRDAFTDLQDVAQRLERDIDILLQPSAPSGVACTVRGGEDALYGPVFSFGLAGDASELLGDVSYRVAPVTDGDLRSMLTSVRAAPRLSGQGRYQRVDHDALVDLLARISELVDDLPDIHDLILEPVIASPSGVVVAGARMSVRRAERQDAARRILPAGQY